jgi:hypothetical protein
MSGGRKLGDRPASGKPTAQPMCWLARNSQRECQLDISTVIDKNETTILVLKIIV